jgi:hypothetical protein
MICGDEENTIRKTIAATPSADAGTDITISQGATANLSGDYYQCFFSTLDRNEWQW